MLKSFTISACFAIGWAQEIQLVPKQESTLIEQCILAQNYATQGLALTKDRYYTSTSRALYMFDPEWNLLQEKMVQIEGVNHVGAIHYHAGFIWAGLLNGPENDVYEPHLDRSIIAKIRANDLEVVQTWDITKDLTWIDPVCYDGLYLWVGDLRDLGIHRYRLVGDQLVHSGTFRYPKAMHFSQGIRVVESKLYTIHTFGTLDGLFEFDIPDPLTETVNKPTQVWEIQETRMHLEGFDFLPESPNQIWHAQGTQIDRYRLKGLEEK